MTIAMFLAQIGITPQNIWLHDPNLQDKFGQTVALMLAKNNQKIPEQWISNPQLQDIKGYTVALLQAKRGIIPDDVWYHNKFIRAQYLLPDKKVYYYTVQNFLLQKSIQVPKQWQYIVLDQYDDNYPMIQAIQCIIPQYNNEYDPSYQNTKGNTVAMYLAVNDYIPQKCWNHNPDLKNCFGSTVADILRERWIIVPNCWYDKKYQQNKRNNDQFEQVIYGNINQSEKYNLSQQNCDGFTIPMAIIQCLNIVPPEQFYHDPSIQNKYGETVAMILAHYNKEIPAQWYHNPTIQNIDQETIALIQAGRLGKVPEQKWYHNPEICDRDQYTVAMYLAENGIIPPKEWQHNPLKKNIQQQTVGLLLAQNGIIPPQCWMHDIEIEDSEGYSIKRYLFQHNYIYINNQFVVNCQAYNANDICQTCFTDGQQQFVKASCGHKVCLDCFQQLFKDKKCNMCPVCGQINWYQKIINNTWQEE